MDLSLKGILKEHRKNIVKGALWLFSIDVFGFLLPFLIKLCIDRLGQKALPSWIPSFFATQEIGSFLLSMCLLYIGISALVAYGRYWWRVHFIWGTFPIFDRVRRGFFGHLSRLHLDFFKSTKVGDMISALSNDTENMRMVMAIGALMFVDSIFSFILFPTILFLLDPVLAAVMVPPLVLIALYAVRWSDRYSKYYDHVQGVLGDLSSRAYEISSGVRVIKSFGVEEPIHHSFVKKSTELRDASMKVARFESTYMPSLYFVLGLAVCVLLGFGGYRVINGQMSLSNFVAFSLYLNMMDWPMMAMGWFIQMYRSARASERRVKFLAETKNPLSVEKIETIQTEAVLSVQNLSYQFSDRNESLFQSLNFEIQPQEWIGLTGPVGSGKTILLELLSRQRDPKSGNIYLNGRSLKSMSAEQVVEEILYVPQETYLFSRSVQRNLNLGLGSKLNDEILWDLLKDLSFDADVLKDRGGLGAMLGERGVNLSGGQKQRLSLGRALLRNREVYLFDDLFSHVDVETESHLIEILKKRLNPSATVILVSQRLDTLRICDRVMVLGHEGFEFVGSVDEGLTKSEFLKSLSEVQRKPSIDSSRGAA